MGQIIAHACPCSCQLSDELRTLPMHTVCEAQGQHGMVLSYGSLAASNTKQTFCSWRSAQECCAHSFMPARCIPSGPVRLLVLPCTMGCLQPSGRLQTWHHGCRPCSRSWASCSTCLRGPGTNGECLPAINAHHRDLGHSRSGFTTVIWGHTCSSCFDF